MMQLLVISPQAELVSALQESLTSAKNGGRAVLLRQYPSPAELARVVQAKKPNVVIVGLSEPERALELIEELKSGYPDILVAAANTQNSSELILAAVRAGAAEYLGPPFDVGYLEQALERAGEEEAKAKDKKGRLIGFLPAHGGSGASTIALHVAAAMAKAAGSRTLLLDFDSHCGTLDFRLQLKPEHTLADALQRAGSLDDLWERLTTRWKGIEVLPAPPRDAPQQVDQYGRTSAVLVSARRVYDWVITDLPPAIFASCISVLTEAEAVYIVCTPELLSLHLGSRKARELRNLGLAPEAVRLVVNRVSSKHALEAKEIQSLLDIPVAFGLRNDYEAVTLASMRGKLVPEDCELGKQYVEFAGSIMGVTAPARQPKSSQGWRKLFGQNGSPGNSSKSPQTLGVGSLTGVVQT